MVCVVAESNDMKNGGNGCINRMWIEKRGKLVAIYRACDSLFLLHLKCSTRNPDVERRKT